MFFSHRVALLGLVLSLLQFSLVIAAVIPTSRSLLPLLDPLTKPLDGVLEAVTNPATYLLGLINSLNTTAATSPASQFALPGSHYTITQNASAPQLRAATLRVTRLTFLYGPPLGGGPYYPSGVLGLLKDAEDILSIQADELPELEGAILDSTKATTSVIQYDGLQTVQDYVKLYPGNWENINPNGPFAGSITNFTQDLYFSMERLANSPYAVRRLNPSSDTLAFHINDMLATSITGLTLQALFQAGRLFYVDYRDQVDLPRTSRYAAACDAFFYIDPSSGDFLPLAIRTNVGSNLIYTPKDSHNDWLLAKIMLNVNDFWFAQWNHLAQTHQVTQIAYMAAIRSISEHHPVLAILKRLMFQAFGIQPLAGALLFLPGTIVDQLFPHTGFAAQSYTSDRYFNKGAGQFRSNYFQDELQARGLIDSQHGPALKHFPFYEDGSVIWNAINEFMTTFVRSYYASDAAVKNDAEIQDWVQEAQGPARAIDFPDIQTTSDLIGVLTHFGHLVSTSHHAVNTNELLDISGTFPVHPTSLWKPVPTTKGVTNVADFLTPFLKVLLHFTVGGLFARPKFRGTNRTLLHMFDDWTMLSRMNMRTRMAAWRFKGMMQGFSQVVGARTFDADGLSQGMPFVWKALDPSVMPYSLTT